MRSAALSLVALFFALSVFSQTWTPVTSDVPVDVKTTLISSDISHSVVKVTVGGFFLDPVTTPSGQAFTVRAGHTVPMLSAGNPDLPMATVSLIIPDQAMMNVRVISSKWIDFPGISVAPSKGVISRETDPKTVPFRYGESYGSDEFYPADPVSLREPYIIRDVRGQTLLACPFLFNPVTGTLRVCSEMTIEVYQVSGTGVNPLITGGAPKKMSGSFMEVYRQQFANLSALTYTPLEEYGNLLIICHAPFMNAMQPYLDWKRAEGYNTEMITSDSAGGTAAAIRSFIAGYYSAKGLTHVLLVGDAPQIPTNTGAGLGGPSDNAYGYIMGNDHYSDVYVGRFSAETEAQVQTQVQRTLDYEKSPQFVTDDWYTTVIGIASDQGPGDDNEMDFEHIRNQQTKLLAYKYTWNPELFDGSQGGNDAPGNPSPAMVSTEVNNGAGLILYTGHGSNTSWGTSGFSNSNVSQLQNAGKLPFIWSVACVNGNFTAGTCFAEAWLRASQGGQPTGAVAFLGSTINQSWNSPMEGQDAMTDILIESDPANIKRTFAGLSINGCMKMIDSYGTDGANMADTWTVFGDPTIMVRTAAPAPLAATCDTLVFIGDSTLAVYCPVDGARVTATLNGTILATTLISGGSAMLAFPPLANAGDTVSLVVTSYNYVPYQGQMPVRDIPSAVLAGFNGYPTLVSPGYAVTFADTSSGNVVSRNWNFPGGTPAFSTEKNPVITYNTRGYFDVQLIASNGYYTDTVMTASYITVDFPASAGAKNSDLSCSVSPNPGNGLFRLSVAGCGTGTARIRVYDLIGTPVYEENDIKATGSLNRQLDLTSLPDGVYFLRLEAGSGMTVRKLVIRK